MIDREYVKLNTSIQTGSNAQDLTKDEDGNIEAVIDLRLPDNLFTKSSGARKVDHVELKPTKMRLSMENTPIAQIPLDLEKTKCCPTPDTLVSSCQLDVYPYSFTETGQLLPDQLAQTVFPNYKNHYNQYRIFVFDANGDGDQLEAVNSHSNSPISSFPKDNRFYNVLKEAGFIDFVDSHPMNLCSSQNHRNLEQTGSQLFIKSIGALEQFLQNALENAVTYACTSSDVNIDIAFVPESLIHNEHFQDPQVSSFSVTIPEFNEPLYYWKWTVVNTELNPSTVECELANAFKPRVILGPQSLTIAYDTAAFDKNVPILWNSPFVETFEHPTQMTIDELRKQVWSQPPPKRVYKYGIEQPSGSSTYNFSLINDITCGVMNIVANKTLRDTLSFLPWIPFDLQKFYALHNNTSFKYEITEAFIQEQQENTTSVDYKYYWVESTPSGPELTTVSHMELKTFTLYVPGLLPSPDPPDCWTMHDDIRQDETVIRVPGIIHRHCFNYTQWENDPRHTTMEAPPMEEQFRQKTFSCLQVDLGAADPYDVQHGSIRTNTWSDQPQTIRTVRSVTQSNDPSLSPGVTILSYDPNIVTVARSNPETTEECQQYIGANIALVGENSTGYKYCRYYLPYDPGDSMHYWSYTWIDALPPVGQWDNIELERNGDGSQYDWEHRPYIGGFSAMLPNIRAFKEQHPNFKTLWELEENILSDYYQDDNGDWIAVRYDLYSYKIDQPNYLSSQDMVPPIEFTAQHEQYPWVNCYVSYESSCVGVKAVTTNTITHNDTLQQEVVDLLPDVPLERELEDLYPNLAIAPNEPFYILDGTSAQVNIGPQEVVGADRYTYKTTVTKEMLPGATHVTYQVTSMRTSEVTPTQAFSYVSGVTNGAIIDDPTDPTSHYGNMILFKFFRNDGSTTKVHAEVIAGDYNEMTVWVPEGVAPLILYKRQEGDIEPVSPLPDPEITISYSDMGVPGHNESVAPAVVDHIISTDEEHHCDFEHPMIRYYLPTTTSGLPPEMWTGVYVEDCDLWIPDESCCAPLYILDFHVANGPDGQPGTWHYTMWHVNSSIVDPTFQANIAKYVGYMKVQTIDKTECMIKTTTETEYYLAGTGSYRGNMRISFVWDNLPMVVLSPIASIVLSLQGIQINQEIQPINMPSETRTGSSLTSVVPVVENYYSLATTLRDLHDELVVVREEFDTTPTYILPSTGGQQRAFKLSAMYITKDGSLKKIYIPPNGVFSVQLTFALSLYQTS